MTQKRCLNCHDYETDEKTLNGEQLPEGAFPYSGVCPQTNTRKRDGWACGDWIQKEAEK